MLLFLLQLATVDAAAAAEVGDGVDVLVDLVTAVQLFDETSEKMRFVLFDPIRILDNKHERIVVTLMAVCMTLKTS